ncbi:hypothetical protein, partial [Mycobacterium tuberculosis]|uniref:hypothetical protein n=1 Tax=Mycobacterium tuberculosis TaxID=1773 RepID=UPI00254F7C3C
MGINYLKSRVFGLMILGESPRPSGKRVKTVLPLAVILPHSCHNSDIPGKRAIHEYRYVYVQQRRKTDPQPAVAVFGIP